MSSILPKTANDQHPTARPASTTPDVQGGFMFVPLNGKRDQKQDRNARKSIRAHVMHNYRDQQQNVANQGSKRKPLGHGPTTEGVTAEKKTGGQKLRFRLKSTGLVETVPYRARRRGVKGINAEQELPYPAETLAYEVHMGDVAYATNDQTLEIDEGFDPFTELLDPALFTIPDNAVDKDLPAWHSQPDYEYEYRRAEEFDPNVLPWPPSFLPAPTMELDTDNDQQDPWPAKSFPWESNYLSTSPLQLVGRTRTDPFGVLPFLLTPTDEVLVDKFQHFTPRSWCPVNAHGPWFGFAMRDELMFHATMYHWSLKFNDRGNTFLARNPRFMEHKLAAIRMVNSRLADPEQATRDETLAAVTAMVNAEIGFGTKTEAANHMNGLHALVQMRGGIENLQGSMDGLLQAFIGWNDLMYSELFADQLRFVKCRLQRVQDAEAQMQKEPCFRRNMAVLGAAEPRVWEPLQGEVIELFHRIRQLCDEVEKQPYASLDERGARARSDRFHALERSLRTLAQTPEDAMHDDSRDAVWRSCAAAGLVYVHHMLRGLALPYRMFDTLCSDLQRSLVATGHMLDQWRFAPELLTWALTVGAVISTGRAEHEWFLRSLADACASFGYVGWNEYRGTLANFLWVGNVDSERYVKIWEQIEPLM